MPPSAPPEKKYKCQYCSRAFSRSEHRSRHERSHTKERPFKCMKCRSTFVRRDLLLRHDRTVHAKDGGVPLAAQGRRRGKRSQPQKKDDEAADAGDATAATAAAVGNDAGSSNTQTQIDGQSQSISHQQPSPPPLQPPTTRRRTTRRNPARDQSSPQQQQQQQQSRQTATTRHRFNPPPPPPAGSTTIDPAALTATTSITTGTTSDSAIVGSAATQSYTLDPDSPLDAEIENAAMLMADIRSRAAGATTLRSRTNSPAAGDYTSHQHYLHQPHQQQNPYRLTDTGNASLVSSYTSGPTSVPPQATAHLQHTHSVPRSTPDRTVLLEPAVGVGVGYHLRGEGRGLIDSRSGNTMSTATTPIPQPASTSESHLPPTSAGDTVLPHIQLPGQNDANGNQYYDPFLQHQLHRKRARDDPNAARASTPTILDSADAAEQYISRTNVSRSGVTPSLLPLPPSNSGPVLSAGRTPPPSSRQSTPLALSPYNYPYPYPASLAPGMGLLNPPGPGSTSSANMASLSSGNLNMQSMLNLSPLVGNRKDVSVSPGPALLSSGGGGGGAGGGGGGGGGVAGMPNPGPTSVPVVIGEGNDIVNGQLRETKRRKGIGKKKDSAGRKRQQIKFPLDYQDSIPQISTEQDYHILFANIAAAEDVDGISLLGDTFNLPRREVINTYLNSYFTRYHPHLPFLHIPTFISTLPTTPPPLLLSVLSLGALLSHARDEAVVLHIASKVLVSHFLSRRGDFDSRQCPLWAMQTTLLNMIFGSWSGDAKALEWTCSIKSLLGNLVSGSRYALRLRTEKWERERLDESDGMGAEGGSRRRVPSWDEWIDEEGCRRTYFAVYVFFGLLTLVFNHPNSMSGDELDEFELPCEEEIWAAPRDVVEKFWADSAASGETQAQTSTSTSTLPGDSNASGDADKNDNGEDDDENDDDEVEEDLLHPPTVQAAHDAFFRGEKLRYSPFATRIMINVLFYEVWNHKRTIVSLQDVVTEFKLRLALDGWESSLRAKIIEEDKKSRERALLLGNAVPDDGARPPHPLLANSLAVYRTARIRLVVDLKPLQEALRYHSPYEIAASMTVARDLVKRDTVSIMEGVVRECCEGMEEVVQMFGRASTPPPSSRNLMTGAQSRRTSASSSPSPSSSSSGSTTPAAPTTNPPQTSTTTNTTFSCGLTPVCATPRPRLTLSPAIKSIWGVEHPLCIIDMLVILTLWLYRLENAGQTVFLSNSTGPDVEPEPDASEFEIALYQRVRNLFGGIDEEAGRARSPAELSAAVARIWGEVLDPEDLDSLSVEAGDDVDVDGESAANATIWGIEKIIGESFKLHSQALIGYLDDMSYVSATAGVGGEVPPLEQQEQHRLGGSEGGATPTQTNTQMVCTEPECRDSTPLASSAVPPATSGVSFGPQLPTSGDATTTTTSSTAAATATSANTSGGRQSIEHLRGARGLPSVGTAY